MKKFIKEYKVVISFTIAIEIINFIPDLLVRSILILICTIIGLALCMVELRNEVNSQLRSAGVLTGDDSKRFHESMKLNESRIKTPEEIKKNSDNYIKMKNILAKSKI